jgi:hypothetical protein
MFNHTELVADEAALKASLSPSDLEFHLKAEELRDRLVDSIFEELSSYLHHIPEAGHDTFIKLFLAKIAARFEKEPSEIPPPSEAPIISTPSSVSPSQEVASEEDSDEDSVEAPKMFEGVSSFLEESLGKSQELEEAA